LKLVYFNTTGTLGGAEMCLLDILATLGPARPDWHLSVLLGEEGPLRQQIEALGVACEVLPLPGNLARLGDAGLSGAQRTLRLAARGPSAAWATASYLRLLKRTLRAAAPDRIQTIAMKAHVLAAWARPKRVPVVWHLHDYISPRPVMARLLRYSARPGVMAVGVSHSVAADAQQALGGRVPVRTIVNAIDLEDFSPGAADARALDAAAGLPPAEQGTIRVGLVATFARWKGHEVFLEAITRLQAQPLPFPCRFYIVGGPIYRSAGSQYTLEELREKAGALGLNGQLGFAGYQAQPAQALRALDVVVHASTRPEPFGRVIVEAMACGKAVIAIQHGGAAELIDNGTTALGCPPNDPDALARAIGQLVADPDLRHRLGTAGRQVALERFDRRRLAEEWAAVHGAGR
jgi:glycosyltransferase involved in cell wall biosynthesis